MRRVLKVSLLFITALTFFIACSDDDDEYDYVIEYLTLPVEARNLVETHFKGMAVTQVRQKYVADEDGTLYSLFLSTGYEIDFDSKGSWISIDGNNTKAIPSTLFGTELPEAIKVYVSAEYPNIEIVEVEKKSYGFKIELKNDIDLRFSSDGKFISVDK